MFRRKFTYSYTNRSELSERHPRQRIIHTRVVISHSICNGLAEKKAKQKIKTMDNLHIQYDWDPILHDKFHFL